MDPRCYNYTWNARPCSACYIMMQRVADMSHPTLCNTQLSRVYRLQNAPRQAFQIHGTLRPCLCTFVQFDRECGHFLPPGFAQSSRD